jgi:hypothetical protein
MPVNGPIGSVVSLNQYIRLDNFKNVDGKFIEGLVGYVPQGITSINTGDRAIARQEDYIAVKIDGKEYGFIHISSVIFKVIGG